MICVSPWNTRGLWRKVPVQPRWTDGPFLLQPRRPLRHPPASGLLLWRWACKPLNQCKVHNFSFTWDQLVYPSVKGFCTKIMKWTYFLKQQNLTNFSMNSTISQAVHASVNRALEGSSPTNNKPTGVKQVWSRVGSPLSRHFVRKLAFFVTYAEHSEGQSDSANKQEILCAYSSDIISIKSAVNWEKPVRIAAEHFLFCIASWFALY